MKTERQVARYGLAILLVGAALVPAELMAVPAIWFLLAVLVSCLYGGLGPGVLAVGLSWATMLLFLAPAPHPYAFLTAAVLANAAIEVHRRRVDSQGTDAEAALNFQLTVDSIPGMVYTMGARGEVEFVNQRILDVTGKTRQELNDWAPLLHPEDRDRVVAQWLHAVRLGEPFDEEHRVHAADGSYRWLQSRGLPLRDAKGRIVRWYNLLTDIHERKQTEEALRQSELNLRMIVDTIPGMVNGISAQGEVEFCNARATNFFGKSVDELKDYAAVIHPEDRQSTVDAWMHALQTGEPFERAVRLRRADGVYRWMNARNVALKDTYGEVLRWYSLLTDIDDGKRAQEALRASELSFRSIVETIPGMLYTLTADGELEFINARITEFFGKSLVEMREFFGKSIDAMKDWQGIMHAEDKQRALDKWMDALKTGDPYDQEIRLQPAGGAYRWVRAHVVAQKDADGRVLRWYGLLTDIDERMRMDEMARGTQDRLTKASKAATLGELSASIAHEVGQPLAAVVANGDACLRWLSADPPNIAKAVEAVERVTRDGKEAGEIVQRIRALFRRTALERLPLDVHDVIREVLALVRMEISRRKVALETSFFEGSLEVVADRVQLQQLVLNLLLNALEAMDPVTDRSRVLTIRTTQASDEAVVEIRDSGIGLSAPDRIFETFYTTKPTGMGMGLAICRSIAEAHGGRLWADSKAEPGATLCFALPAGRT